MTESQDLNDVATAALRLIGAFEHGHSVAALEAVLAADPLVVATALGLLAGPVTVTAEWLPAVHPCRLSMTRWRRSGPVGPDQRPGPDRWRRVRQISIPLPGGCPPARRLRPRTIEPW